MHQSSTKTLFVSILAVLVVGNIAVAQQLDTPPLAYHSWPLATAVESIAPQSPSTAANWWLRRTIGDVIDYLATPGPVIEQHPLVDPEIGPFLSLYHRARVWYALDHIANAPPSFPGVMFHHFYSSGWSAQMPGFSILMDFSDGPFSPNVVAQGLFPLELQQLDALAANENAYFMSHLHSDHVASYLVYRMLQLGKPVYAPFDLKQLAIAAGIPNAANIIVPMQGVTYVLGPVSFQVFQGFQYGGFLDPSNLVGDPTNPFNVQNTSYMFNMNGVTFAHFGDNNDSNVVPWAANLVSQGWVPEVTMNLGLWGTVLASIWTPTIQFLSHEHEYHHLPPNFVQLNVGPSLVASRLVMFWGEFWHHLPAPLP